MSKVKVWIEAFRLRTLPLAFSSIFMGAFLAAKVNSFRVDILIWSVLTTLFLQVLSNLANDYGDAASGVDGTQRTGPKRTVSAGLISQHQMKLALILTSLLALISGLWLIWIALGDQMYQGLIFLALGVAAIVAAIKYTVGRNPYGYAGFGDFFVLLFFGFVGVEGSYYLYTGSFDYIVLLPALSCGLFSVGVLNVNNIRDIESDKASGKFSIPVRVGRSKAVVYHYTLLAGAILASLLFVMITDSKFISYAFLLVIPLLAVNARAVKLKSTASGLDPYLKQLALTTLLYVVLFGLGQIVSF